MTACPTPVTGYTDAVGNVTIPRGAIVPLLDAASEWHETCDPADLTCPSNLVRHVLRAAITAGQPDDVVFVDADVTPGANYVGRYALGTGAFEQVERPPLSGHVHLRTDGRCLHNHGGQLCGRIL